VYRYGFNGMEKDNELNGTGNSYDFGARIYDSRLGRWLSVDPLFQSFPWYTPYQFAGNMPIWAIDLDGLEEYKVTYIYNEENKHIRTSVKLVNPHHNGIKVTYSHLLNGGKDKREVVTDQFSTKEIEREAERLYESYKELNKTRKEKPNEKDGFINGHEWNVEPVLFEDVEIKPGAIIQREGVNAVIPAAPGISERGQITGVMTTFLQNLATSINNAIEKGEDVQSVNINLVLNVGTGMPTRMVNYARGSINIAVNNMRQALMDAGLNDSVTVTTNTSVQRNDDPLAAGAGTNVTIR
jgi:RHS repeat-associated protein